MKAAIYDQPGEPEVLRFAHVPDPVPRDDELLIRVEAISIEGGDLIGRQSRPATPSEILGYAAAGEIVRMGDAAQGFALGQKVTTFGFTGSHAELRAVPAATSWIVPDGLDIKVAAAVPCGAGTAALTLQLGALQRGHTVLILGAGGGVGIAAVQLAARAGARVIGTGTRRETLRVLRDYGLSDAIVTTDGPVNEQVRALLKGEGVDLLIDNVGGPALVDALDAVKDGGRVVLVGVFGGWGQPIDSGHLLIHRKTVIGCFLGPVMGEPATRESISSLLELARRGELKVPIDSSFPLSQAAAAHRRAQERGRIGRVIMIP